MPASSANDPEEAQRAALLARLEAQFGDLDVANLLTGGSSGSGSGTPPGDATAAAGASSPSRATGEGGDGGIEDGAEPVLVSGKDAGGACSNDVASSSKSEESKSGSCDGDGDGDGDSDESSVVEPTAEELERWQQAQYAAARQVAAWKVSTDGGDADKEDAGRLDKDHRNGSPAEAKEEAWVRIDDPPSLGGNESAFFLGRTSEGAEAEAAGTAAAAAGTATTSTDRLDLLGTLHEHSDGALGGRWHPLYRSNVDGRSYVSFVHGIRGYEGPTVLLVGAVPCSSSDSGGDEKAVVGFYTQTPWSEQNGGYGSDRCFLFSVDTGRNAEQAAKVQLYRPRLGESKPNVGVLGENPQNESAEFVEQYARAKKSQQSASGACKTTQHQFLYSTSAGARPLNRDRSPKANQGSAVPPGLGVGGGPSSAPRLHLTETLDRCTALPYDEVFDPGQLLPDSFSANFGTGIHFDADIVEVWAVGGEERIAAALSKQQRTKAYAESQRQRNAKVDKAAFLEDFQSGLMDGGKLFHHRAQARGRHDFEVDDEDKEGHERKGGYKLPTKRSDSVVEPSRTIPGTGL